MSRQSATLNAGLHRQWHDENEEAKSGVRRASHIKRSARNLRDSPKNFLKGLRCTWQTRVAAHWMPLATRSEAPPQPPKRKMPPKSYKVNARVTESDTVSTCRPWFVFLFSSPKPCKRVCPFGTNCLSLLCPDLAWPVGQQRGCWRGWHGRRAPGAW